MEPVRLAHFNVNIGEFRTSEGFFIPFGQMVRIHGSRHAAYDDDRTLYVALLVAPMNSSGAERFVRRAEAIVGPMLGQTEHTFMSQEGKWWQHKPKGFHETDGVRLIMPHLTDRRDEDFEVDVSSIAHTLGAEFEIRQLWLEFQRAGVTKSVFKITP